MTRPAGTIAQQQRVNGEDLCLAAYLSINGIRAYTLFDSGSTTDAVSPDLARVAELPLLALDKPHYNWVAQAAGQKSILPQQQ